MEKKSEKKSLLIEGAMYVIMLSAGFAGSLMIAFGAMHLLFEQAAAPSIGLILGGTAFIAVYLRIAKTSNLINR